MTEAAAALAAGGLRVEAAALLAFHDAVLAGHPPDPGATGPWPWVAANHRCNASLWREEDQVRRRDLPDAELVACKRRIDAHNQRRNDATEAIDEALLAGLAEAGAAPRPDARLASETPGMMIDRLSILALKIHHMGREARRADADAEHRRACRAKLDRLVEQRADLAACLDGLLAAALGGTAHFKTYRQFKMYNDPRLNPELYGRCAAAAKSTGPAEVDVLISTRDRPAALAVTLTALFAQSLRPARVVIADQGEAAPAAAFPEVQALLRLLRARGVAVELHPHLPRRGLAEQRRFLLGRARAPYALFLDDDVVLEPDLLARLLRALTEQRCGFVGSALIGLACAEDRRPQAQHIEFWEGPVAPERIAPGSAAWARHQLHGAANLYHLQTRLGLAAEEQRLYRVAWIGGCVLFDTAKLRQAGGFDFGPELPAEHCGEDALAQLRVMARDGGAGIIPSGAYHQERPTTVPRRDVDAARVLGLGACAEPSEPQRER